MSTYKPGNGLLPGKHRVAVVEYSPQEPPCGADLFQEK